MRAYVALFLTFFAVNKIQGEDQPVGTCSFQGKEAEKEMLPDPMCYDACTNNAPDHQQRYLMCSDMKCFCRTMSTDSAVPLNAGNSSQPTSAPGNGTVLEGQAQGNVTMPAVNGTAPTPGNSSDTSPSQSSAASGIQPSPTQPGQTPEATAQAGVGATAGAIAQAGPSPSGQTPGAMAQAG